jgi:hypothetical protein
MLTFFYSPGSCALATHLALEHSGLAYTAKKVDFSKQEQRSPEFLKINPKGRVPALVTDAGVLTENPALLVYIAQLAPEANLAPLDDPWLFAQMQSFNSYLASTVHVAHAHRYRGYRWSRTITCAGPGCWATCTPSATCTYSRSAAGWRVTRWISTSSRASPITSIVCRKSRLCSAYWRSSDAAGLMRYSGCSDPGPLYS